MTSAGGQVLLFMGEQYYPNGGWCDFAGSYATVEEAQKRVERGLFTYSDGTVARAKWAHIVGIESLKPIAAYDGRWSDDLEFIASQVSRYQVVSEDDLR